MGLANEPRLESGKPRVFQFRHALGARTHLRARKTVHVELASGVPGHLGQQLRFYGGFQLVLGRKTASIPDFKIIETQAHFRKELFFQFFAVLYVALAENLAAHVTKKTFGVVVLATLIDFVQNTQEWRRRKDEPLDFDALGNVVVLFENNTVFLEHVHERRTEIPHGVTDREHETCGIHVHADSSTQGNHGLVRLQGPSPFSLFSGNGFQVILDCHVAHVGHNGDYSRIPFLFAGLETDHGAIVVKVQRGDFGTVPGVVKILAPVFRFPGAVIKARIQIDGPADGVDS